MQTEYDAAGRISGVKQQATGFYYAGSAPTATMGRMQYEAHGGLSAMRLGNQLWETTRFNSRLQPTEISLGTQRDDSSVLRLGYGYGTAGQNNGNVRSQTITLPELTLSQTFTYDALNRLESAQEMSGATENWKQQYVYDRFGNRTIDTTPNNTTPELVGPNPVVSSVTNRITPRAGESYHYDSAGNLDRDQTNNAYTYDAENHLVSYNGGAGVNGGTSYSYDAEGRRVKQVTPSGVTVSVYNAAGQLVAEYGSESPVSRGTSYLTADTLGSVRAVTDSKGQVRARHDYLPFGEDVGAGIGGRTTNQGYVGNADGVRQRFTSKERDDETGLDYFLARYYASQQGRFTSPDPLYIELRRLGDPEQLNLYTYTRNNPLKFIDPTGLDINVTGTEQEAYRRRLQQNLSFQVQINSKTNKVQIVDAKGNALDDKALKALGKTLKGAEKELFKAITNTKNHVTIETVRGDANVDFGRWVGGGTNKVDAADLDLLDAPNNAGGFSSAQVVGHETLEAYAASKKKNVSFDDAHAFANKFFGGLELPDASTVRVLVDQKAGTIVGASAEFPVHGNANIRAKITRQFLTPIPMNAIPTGQVPAHIANVEKKP